MTMSGIDMLGGYRPRGKDARVPRYARSAARPSVASWLMASATLAAGCLLPQAQTPAPPKGNQFIACAAAGQPLVRIPELVSQNGKLRGTIVLSVEANRLKEKQELSKSRLSQWPNSWKDMPKSWATKQEALQFGNLDTDIPETQQFTLRLLTFAEG